MNDSAEMSVGQSSDVEPTCGLNLMRLGGREKFLHCRLVNYLFFRFRCTVPGNGYAFL